MKSLLPVAASTVCGIFFMARCIARLTRLIRIASSEFGVEFHLVALPPAKRRQSTRYLSWTLSTSYA